MIDASFPLPRGTTNKLHVARSAQLRTVQQPYVCTRYSTPLLLPRTGRHRWAPRKPSGGPGSSTAVRPCLSTASTPERRSTSAYPRDAFLSLSAASLCFLSSLGALGHKHAGAGPSRIQCGSSHAESYLVRDKSHITERRSFYQPPNSTSTGRRCSPITDPGHLAWV